MQIHVVGPNDTVTSIARQYNISVFDLISQNNLNPRDPLTEGQALIILTPELTYRIKEGDTLESISEKYQIPIMELLRNNPSLINNRTLSPGTTLVLSYTRAKGICVHGNAFPYINPNYLRSSLPYLNYLSIVNYLATDTGEIISPYDDNYLREMAEEYGVIPLMFLSAISVDDTSHAQTEYNLLLNLEYQNILIDNILSLLKERNFSGLNLSYRYINATTLPLYQAFLENLSRRLREAGYLLFVNIRPALVNVNGTVEFEQLDYSFINDVVDYCIFNQYTWLIENTPPGPVLSVPDIDIFLAYVTQYIEPCKILLGVPTIGHDWALPYQEGLSERTYLSISSALELARLEETSIKFDENSQTPYIEYFVSNDGYTVSHIAWFVDARTIVALLELVEKYNLCCIDIWNTSTYNPALWSVVSSNYIIEQFPVNR